MGVPWLRILIYVLLLILDGMSEDDAVTAAAVHFGVSEGHIRNRL